MNKTHIAGGIVILLMIAGGVFWLSTRNPKPNDQMAKLSASFQGEDAEVISESGVHWHPEVSIYIKGEKQKIPTDLGVGTSYSSNLFYDPMMQMTDIHTHSSDGILHWEVMSGPVMKGHAKLKAFFNVWGKTFNSNQILDSQNGTEGTVKMIVNGQPNTEFENYIVKDKDKIELRFE